VQNQANVLAYIDGFMIIGFAVIGALLLMLLLRTPPDTRRRDRCSLMKRMRSSKVAPAAVFFEIERPAATHKAKEQDRSGRQGKVIPIIRGSTSCPVKAYAHGLMPPP
jgi:hypothetical protein